MLHTSLQHSIESCYTWLVMLSRRHDMVALVRESNLFKVVYSAKINLDDVQSLTTFEVMHLITRGKTTKSKLTAAQKADLLVYIKECNEKLN